MTQRSRTALVTGAAQGIGEAVALRLAEEGVRRFVLLDVDAEGLERTATRLGEVAERVRVESVATDLVDVERSCARLVDALERIGCSASSGRAGKAGSVGARGTGDEPSADEVDDAGADDGGARLDVLVNAAGITSRGGLDDITLETFDRLSALNVRAPLFVMQSARRYMGRGGAIVNITSMLAYGGPPFLLGYSASKAALVALTKGAANTLKWDGIRVFGINLGWTLTPSEQRVQTEVHGLAADWAETVGAKQPFGRLLMPEDPAALVAFLVSEEARMMTGAIVDLDQYVAGTVDDNPGSGV